MLVEHHDDIVIAEFTSNVRLDLEKAMEIVSDRLAFANHKDHYLIISLSHNVSMTTEAKNYLQDPDNGLKNISGAALIASNPLSALIANIFIKTPTQFQSRFFSKMEDALNWIYELKKEKKRVEK